MPRDGFETGIVTRAGFRLSREMQPAQAAAVDQAVAEEVPLALSYNGLAHAVMLATPADLRAFALGFSLSEGILEHPDELLDLDAVPVTKDLAGRGLAGRGLAGRGIELRMRITQRRFTALKDRRRSLAGHAGCGLCGVESLDQAIRDLPPVESDFVLPVASLRRALADLPRHQELNRSCHALHAAAWADAEGRLLHVVEDVGRHNALDKLIGRMALAGGESEARREGFLLLTSRLGHELVQKAVTARLPLVAAISAPTSLALDMAEEARLGVVACARADAVTVYAHGWRLSP